MIDFDDIEGGDDSGGPESGGAEPSAGEPAAPAGEGSGARLDPLVPPAPTRCLSCGAETLGLYCPACGQKADDLRRSIFLLGRNFIEDTFAFDSRMGRTLGSLAVAPGVVAQRYAHGKRSQYTPPVRLFLMVSFLFFLTIGLTNTLFVGLDVTFKDVEEAKKENAVIAEAGVTAEDLVSPNCHFNGKLRFFIKERDLATDRERMTSCFGALNDRMQSELEATSTEGGAAAGVLAADDEEEIEMVGDTVSRVFNGVNWAVANPRAFNDAVNNWLPRVMFLMTPVLALILILFLRCEALVFDHLVLALYMHAAGFAIVGLALILAQLGVPHTGGVAFLVLAIYYVIALKRAYRRGWVKTIWTAGMSGFLYLAVLMTVVMAIVSRIVWQAAG